jgi:hypothetical protein
MDDVPTSKKEHNTSVYPQTICLLNLKNKEKKIDPTGESASA